MKYIDAIKGSLVICFIFIILVIYLPDITFIPITETALTISTFLFAILAGFFTARLNDRYNNIRQCISDEDSYWYSLYKMSMVYGKNFCNKLKEKIDDYYITSFDHNITDYYKSTRKALDNIYEVIYELTGKTMESSYANMLAVLWSIELARNKNAVISKEKLTKSQWTVLILLAIIIIFCLFSLNSNNPATKLIIVLVSTILVLVLLTIRDLIYLRLGGKIMPLMESGQEVLESIGKLRYYNKFLVENGIFEIPKNVKKYRLGIHKPGEKQSIKIIVRK